MNARPRTPRSWLAVPRASKATPMAPALCRRAVRGTHIVGAELVRTGSGEKAAETIRTSLGSWVVPPERFPAPGIFPRSSDWSRHRRHLNVRVPIRRGTGRRGPSLSAWTRRRPARTRCFSANRVAMVARGPHPPPPDDDPLPRGPSGPVFQPLLVILISALARACLVRRRCRESFADRPWLSRRSAAAPPYATTRAGVHPRR